MFFFKNCGEKEENCVKPWKIVESCYINFWQHLGKNFSVAYSTIFNLGLSKNYGKRHFWEPGGEIWVILGGQIFYQNWRLSADQAKHTTP